MVRESGPGGAAVEHERGPATTGGSTAVAASPRAGASVAGEVVHRLLVGLAATWRATAVAAVTLSVFRAAFLLRHGGGASWPRASLARAFVMGARFDVKTAAVAFLPLVALAALAPARGRLRVLPAVWAALAFLALDVAAMVNDGYYGFYHTPIDSIVFGFVQDDTRAVWQSVWEDHPVVLAALLAAALSAAQTWLALFRLRRKARSAGEGEGRSRPGRRAAAALVLALALPVAIRGRLGTFPLNEQDLAVAPEPFVNAMTPNGTYALFLAWRERQGVSIGTDEREGLRRLGFRTPAEAAAALGLAPADAADEDVARALHRTTPENPVAAARPPHVVIAIMESWGADLLSHHSPATNDLLGRLAPHVESGLLFRRFLSAQNGTHPMLQALLLSTPITPLVFSALDHPDLDEAAVLPFRAAGYRVVFATGGSGAWRGLSRSLPREGFDEVHDQTDVLATVPGARAGTWGVFDHELFAWAAGRLREADRRGERLLLVLLTTTNHPPYAVPPEYRVRPLDPSAFAGRALGEPSLRRPILETTQYACDALGGFLDEVRAAGLAGRTIVAATGDHNTRTFFEYPSTADLARRDGVPLFLAVPPAYLRGRKPDVARWASHRDLFPTLAGLALSRARVFRSGDDLLEPARRPPRALARYQTVVADAGAAERLASPELLRWEGGALAPCTDAECRTPLEAILREERAYVALLDWNVRRQVIRRRRVAPAAATAAPR